MNIHNSEEIRLLLPDLPPGEDLIVEISSNSRKSPVREKSRITEGSLTKSELTKLPRSSFIGFLEGFQKKED